MRYRHTPKDARRSRRCSSPPRSLPRGETASLGAGTCRAVVSAPGVRSAPPDRRRCDGCSDARRRDENTLTPRMGSRLAAEENSEHPRPLALGSCRAPPYDRASATRNPRGDPRWTHCSASGSVRPFWPDVQDRPRRGELFRRLGDRVRQPSLIYGVPAAADPMSGAAADPCSVLRFAQLLLAWIH